MFRNKKGSLVDVIVWVVLVAIVIMFIALWTYGHGIITDALANSSSELVRNASEKTFGEADKAIQNGGKSLAFIIIAGMMVNIFISNFLVRSHPAFIILYIIIAGVGVIFSSTVSNVYTGDILTNDVIGSTFQEFTAVNFIIQHLPYFAAVIALFGGIFLVINVLRDEGGGPQI